VWHGPASGRVSGYSQGGEARVYVHQGLPGTVLCLATMSSFGGHCSLDRPWQRGDRRGASKGMGVYVHLGSVVSYDRGRMSRNHYTYRFDSIWVLVVRGAEGSSNYHRAGSGDASVCTQESSPQQGSWVSRVDCEPLELELEPLEAARTRNKHTHDAALCETAVSRSLRYTTCILACTRCVRTRHDSRSSV
jgi:hypothetical protein